MKTTPRRHDLAYVSESAKFLPTRESTLSPPMQAWISDWVARGLPLVVARQSALPEAARPQIRLAATLPLRLGRARLACVTDIGLVRIAPALPVEKVLGVLTVRDQCALGGLSELAERLDIVLGVYGSTAWECLSGESYRRCESDVDVVCDVSRRDSLSPWLRAMESAGREMGDHLDGEIRFPGGQSVAWRELACVTDRDSRVLVKSLYNVGFATVGALMESLA